MLFSLTFIPFLVILKKCKEVFVFYPQCVGEREKKRTNFSIKKLDCCGKQKTEKSTTRTSNLNSPTMLLEGHTGPVYTCRFSHDGANLASAGADKQVLIWHVYGDCENHTVLKGHTNSILQLQWSGGDEYLFTSSADKTVSIWDVEYGARIKKIKSHMSFVNSVSPTKKGTQFLATGSDDGSAKIFDIRMKPPLKTFDCTYQVTAVALSDNALKLYTGGIDNVIKVWDGRKSHKPLSYLHGHKETITSLSLSMDGKYLLSNGMDGCIRVWDIQPFVSGRVSDADKPNPTENDDDNKDSLNKFLKESDERCKKVLFGPLHGTEKLLIKANWSKDANRIVSGSSDKCAYVLDVWGGQVLYKLPGHTGSCNEVDIHPFEPIIVSASSDKTLFLGELF
ncbi:u5 small nuclear ribonucleoprotein 40 kDa protein isoform 1 [Reticulomyxa filosa]|uniref:U5 small nuclear ribonucleoprotein 40 kDa protein isoform 1 n=1 Tax=Reticulomyxa filosa TaxID=46433 RepID=X6PDH3_RETFI|nr:u5 small nuclear ribonucleoprotein 40 kDa protein isoform 1 [Reticulomyxa filosa]|eukprot:ETO36256.1 u5 small nuclear ribonucleoprotein 40 kDa protein isoform 1 [Reticulomyxa filosa]